MTLIPADIQLLLFMKNKENNMQTHGERGWRFMFYGWKENKPFPFIVVYQGEQIAPQTLKLT